MIYLTTGANGAGKTLLTLKDVREQQLKENRPVYYHGFEAGSVLVDWGWLPFNPHEWQDLPDGSICIFDECQNEFPAKLPGAIPDFINAIAQFRRKRGFDFWLVSPHPSLIHINVRRLIENPSWHRHLKRTFGSDMVSVLKFNSPNMQCEKPGAGSSGQVTMRAFPKEVYGWYKSASLHTGKKTIPKQIYFLAVAALLIPALAYFAFQRLAPKPPAVTTPGGRSTATFVTSASSGSDKKVLTPYEYAATFAPRIEGLPLSAPRYDDLNKPVQLPKPAACVLGKRPGSNTEGCDCFTQQATKLNVTFDICKQIALGGWFDDTLQPSGSDSKGLAASSQKPAQNVSFPMSEPVGINAGVNLQPPDTKSTVSRDAEVLAFMAKRQYVK